MISKLYPDRKIMLIGIPLFGFLFRHIGEVESFAMLVVDKQYYIDLGFSIILVALIWLINRELIIRLDQRYSWVDKSLQRFFIQSVSGFSITYLTIALLSFIYNELIIVRPAGFNISNVFSADLPSSLIFVTIIHMIYTGMWMMNYHNKVIMNLEDKLQSLNQKSGTHFNKEIPVDYKSMIMVNHGNGSIPVPIDQIVCIFSLNEISMVKIKEGNTFTVNGTLEYFMEQLSPSDFFRANRQFIVNRAFIKNVVGISSGRLSIHLDSDRQGEIIVSRRRSSNFKNWLGSDLKSSKPVDSGKFGVN